MSLPELSIRQHVLAWMMSGLMVLFGVIAYSKIGVDRFPTVDFPMISVTTVHTGADPSIIDASITAQIEEKVNSVSGIEHIMSFSTPGVSVVTVKFALAKDVDVAFNEVQAKVNQVLRQLPKGIDPPVVAKVEIGAEPVLWLCLTGDRTLQQLNRYARDVIKKRLENISGVGEVRMGGERKRMIRVWLNLDTMQAQGVSLAEVLLAFKQQHVQFPGGFLSDQHHEYMIKLDMEFHRLDALRHLLIRSQAGMQLELRDIARIEDGLSDFRQLARFQGQPTVALGLVKIKGANVVAIVDEAKRRLQQDIEPNLPAGMRIDIASNEGDLIQGIVDGLKEHVFESVLLAFCVVLFFLRNVQATLIVSTAIPVSMLAAIAIAYVFGFTLNLMTLLALLLLIGIVVDDAIVVLENIYRHRQEGLADNAFDAALSGSKQVAFAVIASSLSLVAIFTPVIFMDGMVGRFFNAFAVIVSCGVLASLFVSLTLVPMLCSRYLHVQEHEGAVAAFLAAGFKRMDTAYRSLLVACLRYRWSVMMIACVLFLASLSLFAHIGKGFVPKEDEGRFLVSFKLPLGASIKQTDERLQALESVLASDADVQSYFTLIGSGTLGQVNQGVAYVQLRPKAQRQRKQWTIIPDIQQKLDQLAGVHAFAVKVSIVGGQRGEPLQFSLLGPDLHVLAKQAYALKAKLDTVASLGHMDLDLQLDLPQLSLHIDRQRASDLGLSVRHIAQTIGVLAGGMTIAKYNDLPGDGQRYDIRLRAEHGFLQHPDDLTKIYLMTQSGERVRLDTVVHWQRELAPAVIPKMDLRYAARFYAAPSMPLGAAVQQVRFFSESLLLPGYQLLFTGQAEEFAKTGKNMAFAFAMAMVLIFMVLASQFNSFSQPWVLMLAQPMAIAGGIIALLWTGNTLNIFSMIGLVLLLGLVAKNSILLIDLTNQYRRDGMSIEAALLAACPVRLRPVLMTSLTVIIAMFPAALGLGSGSEMTIPMSVAVIGGMISSTLLTLLVVPSAYSLLEHGLLRLTHWRMHRGQS